jgi:hypothetical protein
MKNKFNDQFEIIKMTNASLVLVDKKTGEHVFIHRNAFNQLEVAEDYRVVKKETPRGDKNRWVEVLVWKSL